MVVGVGQAANTQCLLAAERHRGKASFHEAPHLGPKGLDVPRRPLKYQKLHCKYMEAMFDPVPRKHLSKVAELKELAVRRGQRRTQKREPPVAGSVSFQADLL